MNTTDSMRLVLVGYLLLVVPLCTVVMLREAPPATVPCVFHGFLPPSPSEGCHSVHVNAATQSTGCLPPSPREACHVDHGKVATHARRSLPPSEQRDAGSLLLV
jgi:hypothetical protein